MTEEANQIYDCVVVGAGVSGLTAARQVVQAGFSVLCLDKGRGVGGRLATRRIDDALLDHGAQYFTARSEVLQAEVQSWASQGWVSPWAALSVQESRWIAPQGMTALPKQWIAQTPGLNVQCSQQVANLQAEESTWRLETLQGAVFRAKSLLLTAPMPQCLALFEQSALPVEKNLIAQLQQVDYAPCLVLLVTLKQPIPFAALKGGAWRVPPDAENPVLAWIADNQAKGISPNQKALTVHAAPGWSRAHWQDADAEVQQQLWAALLALLPELGENQALIQTIQVKRWGYALVERSLSDVLGSETPMINFMEDPLGLIAGDGLLGPSVENAFRSGVAAGQALVHHLTQAASKPITISL